MRQLHIIIGFLGAGFTTGGWRMPDVDPASVETFEYIEQNTKLAERGLADAVFVADTPGVDPAEQAVTPMNTPFEPTVLMSALARSTDRIGLIGTASTTYNDPYNLARHFASLDSISGGRAGWNAVTTGGGMPAQNYSHAEHPPHGERYDRSAEFIEAVLKLWRSWGDGFGTYDTQTGAYRRRELISPVNHAGTWFQVRGPLNVAPSPQRHPVVVQSGASGPGRDQCARDPDSLKVMPGIVPVIGGTEAEAEARWEQIGELIPIEPALEFLASRMQVDPSDLDLDSPIPERLIKDPTEMIASQTQYEKAMSLAMQENLTVRELIWTIGGRIGHPVVPVTPEQLADRMQTWVEQGAADGFNVMPDAMPSGLGTFVDHVVPILQKRGLYRREYTSKTLRGHFGLPKPRSLHDA